MNSTKTPIIFHSDGQRKLYEAGLAIVRRKLAGRPLNEQERQAAAIREGNAQIIRKFGSEIALKRWGIKTPANGFMLPQAERTKALEEIAERAANDAVKKFFTKPAATAKKSVPCFTQPKKLHRFATGGLFA